jgi:hypothetical protein
MNASALANKSYVVLQIVDFCHDSLANQLTGAVCALLAAQTQSLDNLPEKHLAICVVGVVDIFRFHPPIKIFIYVVVSLD